MLLSVLDLLGDNLQLVKRIHEGMQGTALAKGLQPTSAVSGLDIIQASFRWLLPKTCHLGTANVRKLVPPQAIGC